jgi:hypothetical protein
MPIRVMAINSNDGFKTIHQSIAEASLNILLSPIVRYGNDAEKTYHDFLKPVLLDIKPISFAILQNLNNGYIQRKAAFFAHTDTPPPETLRDLFFIDRFLPNDTKINARRPLRPIKTYHLTEDEFKAFSKAAKETPLVYKTMLILQEIMMSHFDSCENAFYELIEEKTKQQTDIETEIDYHELETEFDNSLGILKAALHASFAQELSPFIYAQPDNISLKERYSRGLRASFIPHAFTVMTGKGLLTCPFSSRITSFWNLNFIKNGDVFVREADALGALPALISEMIAEEMREPKSALPINSTHKPPDP